jgi:hypothetical protein
MAKPKVSLEEFRAKLDKVSTIDFARLAAFIDGEGCITIARSPRRGRMAVHQHELVVTIANTSPLLFDWLLGTFGGAFSRANGNKGVPVYAWRINELQREEILRRCLPYLIIKRAQAEVGLAFRALKSRKREEFRNSRVTPEMMIQRDELHDRIRNLNGARSRFGSKEVTEPLM